MTYISPTYFNQNYKLIFIPLILVLTVTICIILSVKHPIQYPTFPPSEILDDMRSNALSKEDNVTEPKKDKEKEVIYNFFSNASRSLIAMEIRARRLEDNIKRVREHTRTLLWKNKDKALWKILFKNISKSVPIRHQYHEHSRLERILDDKKYHNRRDYEYKSRANDDFFPESDN